MELLYVCKSCGDKARAKSIEEIVKKKKLCKYCYGVMVEQESLFKRFASDASERVVTTIKPPNARQKKKYTSFRCKTCATEHFVIYRPYKCNVCRSMEFDTIVN